MRSGEQEWRRRAIEAVPDGGVPPALVVMELKPTREHFGNVRHANGRYDEGPLSLTHKIQGYLVSVSQVPYMEPRENPGVKALGRSYETSHFAISG